MNIFTSMIYFNKGFKVETSQKWNDGLDDIFLSMVLSQLYCEVCM